MARNEESQVLISMKSEIDQMKVYVESVVIKEGQKEVLMGTRPRQRARKPSGAA